jgi:hypothetical protein
MDIVPNAGNRLNLDEPRVSFARRSSEIDIVKRPLHNSNESSRRVKIEDITKSFVEQNILDVMKDWERSFSK